MKIRLKKDTEDPRPNRSKIVKKGTELVVDSNSPWGALLDSGEAELVSGSRAKKLQEEESKTTKKRSR